MTIWEIERNRLSGLPQNIESFKKYLLPELSQNNEPKNIDHFKSMYNVLARKMSEKRPFMEKERLLIFFAIVFMNYLVESHQGDWNFEKRFERYNSYRYPAFQTKSDIKDVVQILFISLADGAASFEFFLRSIED